MLDGLLRLLLVTAYALLVLPAKALATLTGRDALHLRRSREHQSYWVEREPSIGVQGYYSQSSTPATHSAAWGARVVEAVASLLAAVAGLFGGARRRLADSRHETGREQGIPDEIYTLW